MPLNYDIPHNRLYGFITYFQFRPTIYVIRFIIKHYSIG
jgi:hypothetical protein